MRKHFIFLAVLALLVAAGAFFVQANGETVYCERCNQDVSQDSWQNWNYTSGDITGGHYRLTDDFFAQTGTIRIPEDTIVCLDLCGYTYSASNIRMFNVAGNFTIMDSKSGGIMLSTGEDGRNGGFVLVQSSGTFELYGGTIRYSAVPGISLYDSALFRVDGGRVEIHNGTVAGGTVKATSSYNSYGGNFMVTNGGRLYIHGGTVTQGIALKSSSKTAQGGNIYASSGSKVVIDGGVVENGYSDAGGGNIFIAEATLEINGGIIRNGHALVSGGNIMANATEVNTVNISGGTITGGIAGGTYATYSSNKFTRGNKGGGNICERSPAGILTISGGTIDGDIVLDYVKTLTLSGAPKIGLGKSGGVVFTDLGTFKANAKGLTEGAEIYVQSSRVFTTLFDSSVLAQTALGYFKGAVRTNISATTAHALQGKQTAQGFCPHCDKTVTWNDLNATETPTFSGHCYLTDGLIRAKNIVVNNDMVLDLNGYILHHEDNRFIFNSEQQTRSLTILDSWAGGKMQGTATASADGGVLYVWANSTFELLSGTLCVTSPVNETTSTEKIVERGGVIYAANKAKINISGGLITGGSVIDVTSDDKIDAGGNIYMGGSSGKLSVTGGIIKSGKATKLKGGNIYSAAPVEITGGMVMDGSAGNGGNIFTTSTCEISGGIVLNGSATTYGGNIYPHGGADITGGFTVGGNATTGGGNLFVYQSKTKIFENAAVFDGKSSDRGGNIAVTTDGILEVSNGLVCSGNATNRGGNIDTATAKATVNIGGGIVILGTSGNGGNIYINNGSLNLTGGNIIGGSAKNGGNIYLSNQIYVTIKDDANVQTPIPRVSHGKATNGNGGNIYQTAQDQSNKYYLQFGNCIVRDGTASGNGQNIYVSENGVFKILSEFVQSTTVYFHESRNPVKGELLTESLTCAEGDFTGELRLENITPNPVVCAENVKLRVIAAEIVMKDGTSLRFGSNEDAIKNYTSDAAYLLANAGDLVLAGGNYTVDVAGQNISITGAGNVTCFDSANHDYKKFGTVTVTGPTLVNNLQTEIDNKTYVTVLNSNQYSFHRLDMGVESISIRPGNAGVYYSCTWNCDSTLAQNLKHFGVAVSLNHMPKNDFTTDKNVLYTESTQENFNAG